jgi:hypothetical protein
MTNKEHEAKLEVIFADYDRAVSAATDIFDTKIVNAGAEYNLVWIDATEKRDTKIVNAEAEYNLAWIDAKEKRDAALAELASPEERSYALGDRFVAYLIDHCRGALGEYGLDGDEEKLNAAVGKARAEYYREHKEAGGKR